jgi:hypothetical protein
VPPFPDARPPHCTQVIYSPSWPSLAWTPSSATQDLCDAALAAGLGAPVSDAQSVDALAAQLALQGLCESALLPACRAALFAARREDVQGLARVLRLVAEAKSGPVCDVAKVRLGRAGNPRANSHRQWWRNSAPTRVG